MNLYNIIYLLPIGTKVFLRTDTQNVAREVIGYEWVYQSGNILFKDGYKLSMNRLDLIAVVENGMCHFNTFG